MSIRASFLIIILVLVSSTHAFDGKRKGFVLGGGIGLAPTASLSCSDALVKSTAIAGGYDIFAGKGLSERNQVYLDLRQMVGDADGLSDVWILHGYFGVTWRRYLSLAKHPLFSSLGLGRVVVGSLDFRRKQVHDPLLDSYSNSTGTGWGYTIGLGYQWRKHVDVSLNYCAGGFDVDDGSHTSTHWFDLTATLMLF